jgi:hypothetical protein
VRVERIKQRVPEVVANGIVERWVDATMFEGLVSVHPHIGIRGQWTVTLAQSGWGVLNLDSEREATICATSLLRKLGAQLGFNHPSKADQETTDRIKAFVTAWGTERVKHGFGRGAGVLLWGPDGNKLR